MTVKLEMQHAKQYLQSYNKEKLEMSSNWGLLRYRRYPSDIRPSMAIGQVSGSFVRKNDYDRR